MITKQRIKDEIDRIPEQHLPVLYWVALALEGSSDVPLQVEAVPSPEVNRERAWHEFVAATYGCLADDPIERGAQGRYETRESLA